MPTRSLVTIIMDRISRHPIHEPLVSYDLGHFLQDHCPQDQFPSVLDPRISYEGPCEDYADNPYFLAYLEAVKSSFHAYYIYSGLCQAYKYLTWVCQQHCLIHMIR